MKSRTSLPESCPTCDRQKPADLDAHRSQISIQKSDLRRASRAADGVYLAARGPKGPQSGVVLMSAILLIERLATAHRCDPRGVIRMIELCFEKKAELARRSDRCN